MRWFNDGWMLGNTFLDYDLSRQHTRLGIGVEYWRDFMKLGANSYLQLSNWKDSPDFSDYKERPANGWDIRAQGWLPALPQLGGKLTYEQYYGDEVGLFGKDHRQKDPHAFTAGIEYTPVPLVTLRAEQRQGKDGENDTRFGVDFRYQLGAPWQQQVDPGAVQAMRSLAGSRHDLVERNNNIVLEYRKKETIRLHAASLVTGYAGEKSPWASPSTVPMAWTALTGRHRRCWLRAGKSSRMVRRLTAWCCQPTSMPRASTITPSAAWPWTRRGTGQTPVRRR
ncbi:hypothetical protein FG183_03040 [Serratia marcescens subsp. marcescens ATCC 13880]|nr:hypothetical protein FG183_03040 [Serratia marcescens subsp. marcescens ATCC 13880]